MPIYRPNGIQEELSQPVAILLDEEKELIAFASQAGYRCFVSVSDFKEYVQAEILGQEAGAGANVGLNDL